MKTMANIMALLAIMLCAGALIAAAQAAPDAALSETSALQQLGTQIQEEEKTYKADIDNSNWVYEQLKKADLDLRNEDSKLKEEKPKIQIELDFVQGQINDWNSKCSKNFSPQEQALQYQCKSDRDELSSKKNVVDSNARSYNSRKKTYDDGWKTYQQTMKDWVDKQSALKTRKAALDTKEQDYKRRLNILQKSPAYRALLRKAPHTKDCRMPPNAVMDFKVLDGDFEKAQRCLQKAWDGAK